MSEHDIVKNCAPTLAGLKTGNTFVCPFESEEQLRQSIRTTNKKLSSRGVRAVPLRIRENRALIYVYRPKALQGDLSSQEASSILTDRGYCPGNCHTCLAQLAKRIRTQEDFPHEIGLFLGYPPEDVRGFMENQACGQKCTGCWKVYGDEESARKRFEQYKKCTRVYRHRWQNGASLERLTVTER